MCPGILSFKNKGEVDILKTRIKKIKGISHDTYLVCKKCQKKLFYTHDKMILKRSIWKLSQEMVKDLTATKILESIYLSMRKINYKINEGRDEI